MKTTVLVYEDINAAEKKLRVATKEEWDDILKANKELSEEHRRHFIRDCIQESDELDSMFIEVEYEEYKKWHSKQVYRERVRKIGLKFTEISLDDKVSGTNGRTLCETISDGVDYEKQVIDSLMMEELRKELSQWKPWGNELLDLYLDGNDDCTTEYIRKILGCSEQYARRMKRKFTEYAKKYLKN